MRPVLAAASLCACQIATQQERDLRVPLHGMSNLVTSDVGSLAASRRLAERMPADDPDCGAGAFHAIALDADVAPAPGNETVLASYANGVAVFERQGHVLASATGYRCEGTADEVDTIAAGNAFGDPTIAIVAKSGGRRAYSRWIGLFRIGVDKRLEPVFTGTIEEHVGGVTRRGAITMLPGALIYRLPDGRETRKEFDPIGRIYLSPGEPHGDPDREGPAKVD